jgi:flagellar basal-body rod protein FlgG
MASSLFHILSISQQDMLTRLSDLDVVSNNLANVNTAGFKRTRSNFQELMDGMDQGGIKTASSQVISTQGPIGSTGNPLDLAISGQGYFGVTLPSGKVGYTRDGEFHLDANNRLVNADGNPVVWQGTIPANAEEAQVLKDGSVRYRVGSTWTTAGTMQLYNFKNPTALQESGNNVWTETTTSGAGQAAAPGSTGVGVIVPGSVEQSNVNMGDEMTQVITLQRAFQLSVRTFQSTDEMINEAVHMRKA